MAPQHPSQAAAAAVHRPDVDDAELPSLLLLLALAWQLLLLLAVPPCSNRYSRQHTTKNNAHAEALDRNRGAGCS
jgi:hypothetical protein